MTDRDISPVKAHPADAEKAADARQDRELVAAGYYESFSGPLPHPDSLARYEEICPGAATRILEMAENQARHRQDLEKALVASSCRSQDRGPVFGFALASMVIGIGAVCIWQGKDLAGLAALIGALTAMVVPFIYGKRKQQTEVARKRSQREGPTEAAPPEP